VNATGKASGQARGPCTMRLNGRGEIARRLEAQGTIGTASTSREVIGRGAARREAYERGGLRGCLEWKDAGTPDGLTDAIRVFP